MLKRKSNGIKSKLNIRRVVMTLKGSVIKRFTKPKAKIINHPNQKLLNVRMPVRHAK